MKLKFKKIKEGAVTPTRGTEFSAGWDLTAIWRNETPDFIEYGTGLALEIPVGKVGLLFPRSSVTKQDMMLKNSVGVVDSDYRGEVMLRFAKVVNEIFSNIDEIWVNGVFTYSGSALDIKPLKRHSKTYNVGERVGQIVFVDLSDIDELLEADELQPSVRGTNGYGSTGK